MRAPQVLSEVLRGVVHIVRSNVMGVAEGAKLSVLTSKHDAPGAPSGDLLGLALRAASAAQSVDLSPLLERSVEASRYLPVFPGEHYRLLAGLARVAGSVNILEIGTFTGLSSLALLNSLPEGGRVTTFDVVPWTKIAGTALRDEDFADGRLQQYIGDLSVDNVFSAHLPLVAEADLIFIDGPKDGRFERAFVDRLLATPRGQDALVVLDDIGFPNMVGLWRAITLPKVDLTSFGHWSGTGIFILPKI